MAYINKQDQDGTKGLLAKAEFGYDDYEDGGDKGRVYIGTGDENKPLAFKTEVEEALEKALAKKDVLTELKLNANKLAYVDEEGNTTEIDLSIYIDDTNLARLTEGTLDGETGIGTFKRDDDSTFTVDFSALLDDTRVEVIDNLTSDSATAAASANQVKILNEKIETLTETVEW